MANKVADRWSPGIALGKGVSGPMQAVGGLFAMSADADLRNDRSLELATEAGAHVVLEKPFAMSRLIRELQVLLAAPEG
jgi:hypothetical protein